MVSAKSNTILSSYQGNIVSKVYLLVWASKAELECTQKDDYSAAQEMKKEIDL